MRRSGRAIGMCAAVWWRVGAVGRCAPMGSLLTTGRGQCAMHWGVGVQREFIRRRGIGEVGREPTSRTSRVRVFGSIPRSGSC